MKIGAWPAVLAGMGGGAVEAVAWGRGWGIPAAGKSAGAERPPSDDSSPRVSASLRSGWNELNCQWVGYSSELKSREGKGHHHVSGSARTGDSTGADKD